LRNLLSILLVVLCIIFISNCKKEDPNTPPIADFTISPELGDTDSVFFFDASASYDIQDSISKLMFRWDFENDSIWDTQFSFDKTISHQYSSKGTYSIILEVKDTEGLSSTKTKDLVVAFGNTAPHALFTINHLSGTSDSLFLFDASESYDMHDSISELRFRWDFETDGIWDTDFSEDFTVSYQYLTIGTYTITLEVKDSKGLTNTLSKQIEILKGNLPPLVPELILPENFAEEQDIQMTLNWSCSDPDGDSIKYDIYLGTSSPPELLVNAWGDNTYTTDTLNADTTYYWRIKAIDDKGGYSESQIWQFKTFNFRVGVKTNLINLYEFDPPQQIIPQDWPFTERIIDFDDDGNNDIRFQLSYSHSPGGSGQVNYMIQPAKDNIELQFIELTDSIKKCVELSTFRDFPLISRHTYNSLSLYNCTGRSDLLIDIETHNLAIPAYFDDSISSSYQWTNGRNLTMKYLWYGSPGSGEPYFDRAEQTYYWNDLLIRRGFFVDQFWYVIFRKKVDDEYLYGWINLQIDRGSIYIYEYAIQTQ